MALTLQQQQHQSLAGNNQRQRPASILLNSSDRQYSFTLAAPSRHRPTSSSASSTMSSQSDASSNPPANGATHNTPFHPTGRRILVKFAPLPDPRKLDEESSPLSSTQDIQEAGYEDTRRGISGGLLGAINGLSPSCAKPIFDNGTGGGAAVLDANQQKSPRWSTKRLLRPLLSKSSHGNSPAPSETPSDSLFRPSSIDSVGSTQSAAAATGGTSGALSVFSSRLLGPKCRSTPDLENQRLRAASSSFNASASGSGSVSRATSALLAKMTPLTSSISESSVSASTTLSSGTSIRRTRSQTSGTGVPAAKKRIMLNGRMYGSRRGALTPDPSFHPRVYEQEFNEWGSGLGSVPSNRAAGAVADWDRVRSGGTGIGNDRPAEEEDDGSGMGWVKRRREARERAKREAQEGHAAQSQQEQSGAAPAHNPSHSAPLASPSEYPKPLPPTSDESAARAEGPPDAGTSWHPESSDPVRSSSPHISRPHSSAAIRNPSYNDGPSPAYTMPIPQIIIDSARSSTNVTPVLSSSTLPSAPAEPQTSQPHDTHTSASLQPYGQPEHVTEMAVVRPPLHRRSDSRRHDSYHPHHQHAASLEFTHHAVEHEKRPEISSSTDGDVGVEEPDEIGHELEKDDAATLRARARPGPPAHRQVLRRTIDSDTSSTSSELSTEEDADDHEDYSEFDGERDDEDDEEDEEVSLHFPSKSAW